MTGRLQTTRRFFTEDDSLEIQVETKDGDVILKIGREGYTTSEEYVLMPADSRMLGRSLMLAGKESDE